MDVEFKDDRIRIKEWIPLAEARRRIKNHLLYRPIECRDNEAFAEFYRNLLTEPDRKWTALMWEIFKDIRYREMALISPSTPGRYLNCGKPEFMKREIRTQTFRTGGQPFHFFASNALIRHAHEGRKADMHETRMIWGFDYLCDIDSAHLDKAHLQAREAIDLLHSEGIKMGVLFTGRKGFHIRVYYDELLRKGVIEEKEWYTDEDMTALHQRINKHIKANTRATPDVVVGGGEMQLERVPYSTHPTTLKLCLPLTKKQFNEFTPDMAAIENVLKMDMQNRGVPKW